jgi:5-formaminoimidazole-4-carboxamide-1-(beta)-D-ribofuranosyl 5'-monophosphate synthetase
MRASKTVAVAKTGRERAYREFPVVDHLIVLNDYAELVKSDVQERLRNMDAVFVPNRSFAVYVGYDRIENDFRVPVFGNKFSA